MKVTMVTAYFAPEISPITHLYENLAADLTRLGAEVTVVTGQPNRGLTEETWRAYLTRTDERTEEGYRILRVGGNRREGNSLLGRGWSLFRQTFDLYHAAKQVETDVYLLGSMPPMLGLVGAKLHKKARTVFILQDIFPDTILLMGKFSEGHPVIRLARKMEQYTYRHNSRLITLSEDMKQTLLRRGVEEARIRVIPNWADTDSIHPVSRADNPLFAELGLEPGRFYALYAGALGILQNPDLLADTAKLLTDLPEVTLLVLGSGAIKAHLQERIEREQIQNLRLLPLQSVERVSQVYALGDVALITLKKGVTACAMPSKTWTAMAAGTPVIATADPGSHWERMILEAGSGCVPPEDPVALAEAIRQAYQSRETLPERGNKARTYMETKLSRSASTTQYYEVIKQGEQEHV